VREVMSETRMRLVAKENTLKLPDPVKARVLLSDALSGPASFVVARSPALLPWRPLAFLFSKDVRDAHEELPDSFRIVRTPCIVLPYI